MLCTLRNQSKKMAKLLPESSDKRAETNDFSKPERVMNMSMMCVREDWTDFRTRESLCRKGGVSLGLIPRLAKELADNAVETHPTAVEWR
jgi:hypothetical protein